MASSQYQEYNETNILMSAAKTFRNNNTHLKGKERDEEMFLFIKNTMNKIGLDRSTEEIAIMYNKKLKEMAANRRHFTLKGSSTAKDSNANGQPCSTNPARSPVDDKEKGLANSKDKQGSNINSAGESLIEEKEKRQLNVNAGPNSSISIEKSVNNSVEDSLVDVNKKVQKNSTIEKTALYSDTIENNKLNVNNEEIPTKFNKKTGVTHFNTSLKDNYENIKFKFSTAPSSSEVPVIQNITANSSEIYPSNSKVRRQSKDKNRTSQDENCADDSNKDIVNRKNNKRQVKQTITNHEVNSLEKTIPDIDKELSSSTGKTPPKNKSRNVQNTQNYFKTVNTCPLSKPELKMEENSFKKRCSNRRSSKKSGTPVNSSEASLSDCKIKSDSNVSDKQTSLDVANKIEKRQNNDINKLTTISVDNYTVLVSEKTQTNSKKKRQLKCANNLPSSRLIEDATATSNLLVGRKKRGLSIVNLSHVTQIADDICDPESFATHIIDNTIKRDSVRKGKQSSPSLDGIATQNKGHVQDSLSDTVVKRKDEKETSSANNKEPPQTCSTNLAVNSSEMSEIVSNNKAHSSISAKQSTLTSVDNPDNDLTESTASGNNKKINHIRNKPSTLNSIDNTVVSSIESPTTVKKNKRKKIVINNIPTLTLNINPAVNSTATEQHKIKKCISDKVSTLVSNNNPAVDSTTKKTNNKRQRIVIDNELTSTSNNSPYVNSSTNDKNKKRKKIVIGNGHMPVSTNILVGSSIGNCDINNKSKQYVEIKKTQTSTKNPTIIKHRLPLATTRKISNSSNKKQLEQSSIKIDVVKPLITSDKEPVMVPSDLDLNYSMKRRPHKATDKPSSLTLQQEKSNTNNNWGTQLTNHVSGLQSSLISVDGDSISPKNAENAGTSKDGVCGIVDKPHLPIPLNKPNVVSSELGLTQSMKRRQRRSCSKPPSVPITESQNVHSSNMSMAESKKKAKCKISDNMIQEVTAVVTTKKEEFIAVSKQSPPSQNCFATTTSVVSLDNKGQKNVQGDTPYSTSVNISSVSVLPSDSTPGKPVNKRMMKTYNGSKRQSLRNCANNVAVTALPLSPTESDEKSKWAINNPPLFDSLALKSTEETKRSDQVNGNNNISMDCSEPLLDSSSNGRSDICYSVGVKKGKDIASNIPSFSSLETVISDKTNKDESSVYLPITTPDHIFEKNSSESLIDKQKVYKRGKLRMSNTCKAKRTKSPRLYSRPRQYSKNMPSVSHTKIMSNYCSSTPIPSKKIVNIVERQPEEGKGLEDTQELNKCLFPKSFNSAKITNETATDIAAPVVVTKTIIKTRTLDDAKEENTLSFFFQSLLPGANLLSATKKRQFKSEVMELLNKHLAEAER